MFWLHIVIFVGLLSIFIPVTFFLIIGIKMNNLLRSLLVMVTSILFTITPIFYVYSGMQLYIFISLVISISIIAGCWSYSFFQKHIPGQFDDQAIS